MVAHDNPRPIHAGLRHYRVLDSAHGGATIRSAPHRAGGVLGRLHPGEDWYGDAVQGQRLYVTGFGSSDVWVVSLDQRFVWSGMLEEVL